MYHLINEFLTPHGLLNPSLDLLVRNANPYRSLLYQPGDRIELGENFIRIADTEIASAKFRDFFRVALEQDVELAVSPEYSCPWENIHELINQNNLPHEGKLWVLGCSSIKPADFQAFVNDHAEITWLFENEPVQQNLANNNDFLNPLCYLFKTRTNGDQIRNVGLVQFKTHPMGGPDAVFEQQRMIRGNTIYVIENLENSIKLFTLNCSDVAHHQITFNRAPNFLDSPYLIIHVQLNKAPHNVDFGRYRDETFRQSYTSKEFIILNWAHNTSINTFPAIPFGGSAIYLKTQQPAHKDETNINDDRLTLNHKRGLYYTRWYDRRSNVFYLNYDEGIYLYRNIKVSQLYELPAHYVWRTGPEMVNAYKWRPQTSNWQIESMDDGFTSTCATINGGNFEYLLNRHDTNPVDAERLISISVGKALTSQWHHPFDNSFFQVSGTEICNRMTFTQYPHQDTILTRKAYLRRFNQLQQLITEASNIPDLISDLRENCHVRYREGDFVANFNVNLFSINDLGSPATGAYLGEVEKEDALSVLNDMIDLFKEDQFGKRVVVWYRNGDGDIIPESIPNKPKITDNTTKSRRSYKKTSK